MSADFYRDFNRRDCLRMSIAGSLGVSFSGWLPRLARAVETGTKPKNPKSCIVLWMTGGPAQTDTFDLKPEHENGGPFETIETAVPGIHISEHLPLLAKQMKDMAIIRSMTTKEGDHGRGTQLMHTGFAPGQPLQYPTLGALVAKEIGPADNELPNFVSLSSVRFSPSVTNPGYLGPEYAPLIVSGDSDDPQARADLTVENLKPPLNANKDDMRGRFDVLQFLQKDFSQKTDSRSAKSHRANYDRALRMVESEAKGAFKLSEENNELRDKYGRNRFGQGCLLARRLVERGVSFVEVSLSRIGNNSVVWDTHSDNFNRIQDLSAVLDPAWSALMDDLRERGLLESTLIVWMGEFGRTPKINNNTGRDHFPAAWSTVLAGGGIRGGQVIGDTGKDGMAVKDRPVTTPELLATVCQTLGIDPHTEYETPGGRPVKILDDGGIPIEELIG